MAHWLAGSLAGWRRFGAQENPRKEKKRGEGEKEGCFLFVG